MSEAGASKLTAAERARIARNREKALQIRATKTGKLTAQHPYARETGDGKKVIKIQGNKFVDSGGGFLIEQPLLQNENGPNDPAESTASAVVDEALQIPVVYQTCLDCSKEFVESYLMTHFNYLVCDACRDSEEKHSLITRTEAKTEYLLKDCDLDKREPILKFILRKNPHNVRWGDMKLYLHLQIEQRALEVWGSEEQLIKEREERDEKRDKAKLKKYNKNLKQLRMEVRSSLFDRTSAGPHKHVYGEETYNEENDDYTHSCMECGFSETYEKM
ncbi:DNA repair protein complementing XP-A cells homolog [Bradysia coprophila]|uniref:DNA repair protein complementing XP-A cells homolog n=1 Tax=Bradysia coprophila TaxID=38358 RepID=UPI00187D701E|nr:DNA repair protein complementing XP-A cells homolog [Bradysia coprophila]